MTATLPLDFARAHAVLYASRALGLAHFGTRQKVDIAFDTITAFVDVEGHVDATHTRDR